jgi:hypothetical protein
VQIDVDAQWIVTFGRAQLRLDLHPGQTVPVFYALPWTQFSSGAIGHTTQSRPGVEFLIGVAVVPLVLVGFLGILIALAS